MPIGLYLFWIRPIGDYLILIRRVHGEIPGECKSDDDDDKLVGDAQSEEHGRSGLTIMHMVMHTAYFWQSKGAHYQKRVYLNTACSSLAQSNPTTHKG